MADLCARGNRERPAELGRLSHQAVRSLLAVLLRSHTKVMRHVSATGVESAPYANRCVQFHHNRRPSRRHRRNDAVHRAATSNRTTHQVARAVTDILGSYISLCSG